MCDRSKGGGSSAQHSRREISACYSASFRQATLPPFCEGGRMGRIVLSGFIILRFPLGYSCIAHTICCWTLGGTGSKDLKSIVKEPWPPVMLF